MRLKLGIRYSLLILFWCGLITPSMAQTWPERPVRIVVSFPPGGGLDVVARLLAKKLAEQTGGSFIVENRAGAGILGVELVSKAAPDGYTLLTTGPEFSINPSVRSNLRYNTLKDFVFISQLTSGQYMLASHPSVPVKTVQQLVALAKARPGLLNYGSSGTGGLNHLAAELLQSQTGIRWVHVPFKGTGPNLVGLMGGEIDFAFGSITALIGSAQAGKVRAIAVTGPKRSTALPNVPTINESGVAGYSVTGWYGLYAPSGTSEDIVRRLHTEADRGMNSADAKELLAKAGTEPHVTSPAEFSAFVRAEIAKWSKVAKDSGVKID